MSQKANYIGLRTSLLYAIAAGLWILLSDRALELLCPDPVLLGQMQTYKGWFFVAVTAGLLYASLRAQLVQMDRASQACKNAETDRHEAYERIAEAFVAIDRNGRYTYLNAKAGQLLGHRPEDLVGKQTWSDFPEATARKLQLACENALADQKPVFLDEFHPTSTRWLENRIYPSPEGLTVYFQDITDRKRAEELLNGQKEVLELIAGGADLTRILTTLIRVIESQNSEVLCSFLLLDSDGVHLRLGAAPSLSAEFLRAMDGLAIGPAAASCGTAAFRREPVIVEDIATDPLWQDFRLPGAAQGVRAGWSTPIFDGQRHLLGTFALYSRQTGRPTPPHQRLIEIATQLAAVAMGRQQSEVALRRSENRYRGLVESNLIGVIIAGRDGGITEANNLFLSMVGRTREELQAGLVRWDNMTPPEWKTVDASILAQLSARGAGSPVEKEYFHSDGHRVPVLLVSTVVEGSPTDTFCLVLDLTERKQAEHEARHLANFPELNPNPVLEFSAKGLLTYHNPAALGMAQKIGFSELSGLLPPETPRIVSECLATRQPRLRVETKHGKYTLSWSFYPIIAQQVVHCYVGDISSRLQLEEQLRQAQKMEAIGQLSGGIAHDFNNLLTVIMGNLSLVQSSAKLARADAECLQEVAHAATRAANLTRQLLAFSRQQVMQPQDLDLNVVVENISKMLRRVLTENVEIDLRYAPRVLPIHADPGMLEQVILNLCINARDAMPRGGRLTLETATEIFAEEAVSHEGQVRAGSFARLTITDTGTGIAPENLKRIFEPFFTTKEVGKGTGLGLATAYGLVQQHRGWLNVQSEQGKGTTFQVYFPLVAALSGHSHPPIISTAIPGGNETILLVEDEAAVQMVAKVVLLRLGYRLLTANNGTEAIQIWREHKAEIQLLLTDMVMPEGISGKDLARRFRKEMPELKILFMSGYNADIAGTNFPQMGGRAFLGKPFEVQTLATAVRQCLDSRPEAEEQMAQPE